MNKNIKFSNLLREVRVNKGLSQEEFADIAKINEKNYGRIERGESSPTIKILFKICDNHNIILSKLFESLE